ncbi:hypothetical protein BU15DRAFT_74919 [Melanogaster broomeanus]|nr:hypothetical protein BU15DRAFT_74919 [Melanogaster broomeanus]
MSAPHRQELLDFQMNDSNFQKMIRMVGSIHRKLKIALTSKEEAADAFRALDEGLPSDQKKKLLKQERKAMTEREGNPAAMDIYQIQLDRAPTMKSIELAMLSRSHSIPSTRRGSSTWLARGLHIQQSQIQLRLEALSFGHKATEAQRLTLARKRDRLGTDVRSFVSDAPSFLGQIQVQSPDEWDSHSDDWIDYSGSDEDDAEVAFGNIEPHHEEESHLPFPSFMGRTACMELGIEWLAEEELELRKGQANDSLQHLRMALAEKASDPYHPGMGKINTIELTVKKHAALYRACRQAMISLEADEETLSRYQVLEKEHLKPGSGPWMCKRDTELNDWMSEFYRGHWLRAKALKDRWEEEVELAPSRRRMDE